MVENLKNFSKNILKLKKTTISNSIKPINNLIFKKNLNTIAIHPSSGNINKNWDTNSFLKLAKDLKKINFNPIFIVSPKEKKDFLWIEENGFEIKTFITLSDLASFVYEVGYVIGNDSGIGHLASNLQIPTISIFRNLKTAKLWRPGWKNNEIVYPNNLIPNFSIFRLRDKYWKKFISIQKIIKKIK